MPRPMTGSTIARSSGSKRGSAIVAWQVHLLTIRTRRWRVQACRLLGRRQEASCATEVERRAGQPTRRGHSSTRRRRAGLTPRAHGKQRAAILHANKLHRLRLGCGFAARFRQVSAGGGEEDLRRGVRGDDDVETELTLLDLPVTHDLAVDGVKLRLGEGQPTAGARVDDDVFVGRYLRVEAGVLSTALPSWPDTRTFQKQRWRDVSALPA